MTHPTRPIRLFLAAALILSGPAMAQTAPAPQPAAPTTATPAATSPPAMPDPVAHPVIPIEAPVPRQVPSVQTVPSALLPSNLSPWGMFLGADIVVKVVLIGLAFASVVTWTVWLAKSLELLAMKRKAQDALTILSEPQLLAQSAARLERKGVALLCVRFALGELDDAEDMPAPGVKERIELGLERIEAAAGRRMNRGTGILATIGSTAPFVGLFGTVWGIMNSFVGISTAHTTNLAVVAPGIAEALLATAIGLVAAIPAVVIYNVFARAIGGYRALLSDIASEIMRQASRELDRRPRRIARAAE